MGNIRPKFWAGIEQNFRFYLLLTQGALISYADYWLDNRPHPPPRCHLGVTCSELGRFSQRKVYFEGVRAQKMETVQFDWSINCLESKKGHSAGRRGWGLMTDRLNCIAVVVTRDFMSPCSHLPSFCVPINVLWLR